MTSATIEAQKYGLKPLRPKRTNPYQCELQNLLANPNRETLLATFESAHQLPKIPSEPKAPYAREARYLLMSAGSYFLPETARNLINPHIWYALAGLDKTAPD